MLQTVEEIEADIITAELAESILAPVPNALPDTTNSITGIRKRWRKAISRVIHEMQMRWEAFKADILYYLFNERKQTVKWYIKMLKAYQQGFNLLPDDDQFDNTGYTQQQIDDSKIIKYVACPEQENQYGRLYLRIKIAGTNGTDLVQIDAALIPAIYAYYKRIRRPGLKAVIESLTPDGLKQKWTIYYDPLILKADGSPVLPGADPEPARTSIVNYLYNLPFNGEYLPTLHQDFVQKVSGVVDPKIRENSAQFGLYPYQPINDNYIPDAGWMRFIDPNTDLIIEYIAKNAIEQQSI